MKTLHKLQKSNFEIKETFIKMAEDVANCYSKSTPKDTITSIEKAYYEGLQAKMQLIINYISTEFVFYNSASLIIKHLNTLGISVRFGNTNQETDRRTKLNANLRF